MSTLLLLLDSEIEIYVCSDNRWVVKWWTLWDTYLVLEESTKSWSKAVSVVWNVMAVTAIVLSWSLVTKLTEEEKVGGSLRRSSPILWKKALTTSSSLARGWTFFLMRWNRVTPHILGLASGWMQWTRNTSAIQGSSILEVLEVLESFRMPCPLSLDF